MTRKTAILLAAGGSLALLLGAFAFQHLGGLAPCKMCIWQRWPHAVAIGAGGAALMFGGALLPLVGALSALTTAGIGVYHTGVERAWWEGPSTCSSGNISGLTPEQLLEQIQSAPLVRCDEVVWQLAGLSMASWNAIISVALVTLWTVAVAKSRN